ncbi:MAG TPA: hypothetical protein VM901_01925 [Bdellovibrionota bacterium]|jgi:hypothetical protein|nr:hypothetical protein [Bdellovibrionota bacterium]
MKKLFALMLSTSIASVATAAEAPRPLATGTTELRRSGHRAYEVTIDGDVAEKLYDSLDIKTSPVDPWINKVARGIVCGKNTKTEKYACSLSVDNTGIE